MPDELEPDRLQRLQVALELTARLLSNYAFGEGDRRDLFANRANFFEDMSDRYLPHLIFIVA